MKLAAVAMLGLLSAAPATAQTSPFAPIPSPPVGEGGSRPTQAIGSPPEVGPWDNSDLPPTGGIRGVPGENNPALVVAPPVPGGRPGTVAPP